MKILILILSLTFMTACSTDTVTSTVSEITEDNAAAPNIMVNDCLYHSTGELSDGRPYIEAKEKDYHQEFEVNGTISSSVEGYELPHENNQSNFGTGYEYHIVDEQSILVKINGLWIRYEQTVSETITSDEN